jgi:predicted RNA methylase
MINLTIDHNDLIHNFMATDISKILNHLYEFYDFDNRTVITVGAGGGQIIEYGRKSKNVLAIDYDEEALNKLKDKLVKSGLDNKFTLIHADFTLCQLQGDIVMFEFCLHEIEDPGTVLKHALTMAPNVIIADHWPGSEWAYIGAEEEKIAKSWETLKLFQLKKIQKFDTVQFFHDYEEIYQKVKPQGETSIERISDYKGKMNFTIPMSYGIALI